MSEPQQHHVEAARLCADAALKLDEAAQLLDDDYDARKQQQLIQSLSEACDAAIDWLLP